MAKIHRRALVVVPAEGPRGEAEGRFCQHRQGESVGRTAVLVVTDRTIEMSHGMDEASANGQEISVS